MDYILKQIIPPFTSIGPWLSKKGAFFSTIIGFIFAIILLSANCVPTLPITPEKMQLPWWHVGYIILWPITFFLIWLTITQIYLRTGKGTKIGLAYEGHSVNIQDWSRTRRTLRRMLEEGEIKNVISLRLIPFSSIQSKKISDKFTRRYGFSIFATVEQSPSHSTIKDKKTFSNFSISIPIKQQENEVYDTILPYVGEILQKRKIGPRLVDVLDAQARNLHDIMLIFVATYCYLREKYKDASAILKHLDKMLEGIFATNESPRLHIRYLRANCIVKPTQFLVRDIPPYEKLQEFRQNAEEALIYFDDFPFIPVALGRIRFLAGDVDAALEITNRFITKAEEMKSSGIEVTKYVQVKSRLNAGFLSFIQGHWVNSYNHFCEMLKVDDYRKENWDEVISFIDHVRSLERYDGIEYLQVLYRLIANKSMPNELRLAAREWVAQDQSRRELASLLNKSYPPLSQQIQGTEQQKKLRYKHKNKRRKKRR